jgi:hypothetical protein
MVRSPLIKLAYPRVVSQVWWGRTPMRPTDISPYIWFEPFVPQCGVLIVRNPWDILSPEPQRSLGFMKLGFESLVASHVVHTYIQYMYIYSICIYIYVYIYIYIISPNIDAVICTTIKSEKLVWLDPVVIWLAGRHQSQAGQFVGRKHAINPSRRWSASHVRVHFYQICWPLAICFGMFPLIHLVVQDSSTTQCP